LINSSRVHGNVTVDGYGPGNMPARCVEFQEWEDGALAAGDAAFSYSHVGVVRETVDRAGDKFPFKNRSLFTNYQDHLGGDYLERLGGKNGHMVERWMKNFRQEIYTFNPVSHAYRTSVLIRGERPYALVIDDIRKPDDREHSFYFQMNMRDPELEKNIPSPRWLGRRAPGTARCSLPQRVPIRPGLRSPAPVRRGRRSSAPMLWMILSSEDPGPRGISGKTPRAIPGWSPCCIPPIRRSRAGICRG
jgi:hypothetical protein